MANGINLNNYLSNLSSLSNSANQSDTANVNTNTPLVNQSEAVAELKNMLVGEIFTGLISDLNNENALIKLDNGQLFEAKLTMDSNNYQKGDVVTFLVESKDTSTIAIKALDTAAGEVHFANKALEAANLATTKTHLDMIKGLLSLNMPIDKNTLNDISKYLAKYPDANLDTILRLYKLDIPVTNNSINEFEAMKLFENNLSGTLSKLSEDIFTIVDSMLNENNSVEAKNLVFGLLDAFLPENKNNIKEKLSDNMATDGKNADMNTIDTKLEIKGNNSTVAQNIINFFGEKSNSFSDKISMLKDMEDKSLLDDKVVKELLKDDKFREEIVNTIKKEMFLKPSDVSEKDNIKKFYERLIDIAKDSQEVLKKAGLSESNAFKGFESVKNTVEFMNELNHNLAYIQMPIKMTDGETRGDLYVYTNKKNGPIKDGELTALLHLDMINLGPMDVYVRLHDKTKVSTNFCLESVELLDFVYEHIDILTKRLNDKGYDFKPTMTINNKSEDIKENNDKNMEFDVVNDFIDVCNPIYKVSRYIFDTKA